MKAMKKYIISLFAALLLVCSCPVCVYAESDSSVSDNAASDEGLNVGRIAVFAVVGGVVVGFITAGGMKAQLKSVHSEKAARQYIKQGSFNVKVSRDIYLYKKIEQKPRENKS